MIHWMKNPLNWYINHHLNTCAFMWHLCLLTGIFIFLRCRCNFMWSSFLRYHDLSLKNDPDAVRHLKPPIFLWELDWSHKTDTEHDPWLLWQTKILRMVARTSLLLEELWAMLYYGAMLFTSIFVHFYFFFPSSLFLSLLHSTCQSIIFLFYVFI